MRGSIGSVTAMPQLAAVVGRRLCTDKWVQLLGRLPKEECTSIKQAIVVNLLLTCLL